MRLRGTRTIRPLMLENERRRGRLFNFLVSGGTSCVALLGDNLIRERK